MKLLALCRTSLLLSFVIIIAVPPLSGSAAPLRLSPTLKGSEWINS